MTDTVREPSRGVNAGILWSGASLLDGAPVMLIASGLEYPSANSKTGDMIQTWVLRRDMHPVTAKLSGADVSICGDCPLASGHGCYVNVHYAPAALWRAREDLPAIAGPLPTRGRPVRVAAYGDPAAVPIREWQRILPERWTGFTHQWRSPAVQPLRSMCMASTEDTASTREAQALGWRTFRMRPRHAPLLAGEIECPNTTHDIQCADCALCRGTRLGAKSISIEVHGPATTRAANVSRWRELALAGSLTT